MTSLVSSTTVRRSYSWYTQPVDIKHIHTYRGCWWLKKGRVPVDVFSTGWWEQGIKSQNLCINYPPPITDLCTNPLPFPSPPSRSFTEMDTVHCSHKFSLTIFHDFSMTSKYNFPRPHNNSFYLYSCTASCYWFCSDFHQTTRQSDR